MFWLRVLVDAYLTLIAVPCQALPMLVIVRAGGTLSVIAEGRDHVSN